MSTQTEAEAEAAWFTCTDPRPMVALLRGKERGRKFRLFACACCRRVAHLLTDDRSLQALAVIEHFLDGTLTLKEYADGEAAAAAVYAALGRVVGAGGSGRRTSEADRVRLMASVFAAQAVTDCFRNVASAAADCCGALRGYGTADLTDDLQLRAAGDRIEAAERAAQAALLRDIFGNPFQPVALDPAWRTAAVRALAREMYDRRDFSAMPDLADALQDAGCENDRVLSHCRYSNLAAVEPVGARPDRGPVAGQHVRGCWVVDQILGKQ
jgi:hypothetical protein